MTTRVLFTFMFIPVLYACLKQPERPACSEQTLAQIEAAYVAEAVAACKGKTVETCPELPAIEKKYSTQREEWVSCR